MRKRFLLIPIMIAMILISSCTSVMNADWNKTDEGLPQWTTAPHVRKGHTVYVSTGDGKGEEAARLDAMTNLLKEMSDDLGWDAYTLYYRELTTTDAIAAIEGRTIKSHYRKDDMELTHAWVMFEMDTEKLDALRTEEKREFFERTERMDVLVEEASECYRDNRDVEALEKILDALLLALSTDDRQGSEELLDIALRYLEPLEFRVEQKGTAVESSIRVIRYKGLFSPKVKNAPVVFYYDRSKTTGDAERDSVSASSGSSGEYTFVNTDPFIKRIGEVTVSLELDYDKLYQIEEKGGLGFFQPFWDMLSTKTVSYSYDIRNTGVIRATIDTVMTEYDITGRERIEGTAIGAFAELSAAQHFGIPVSRGIGEDDEAILKAFTYTHPEHKRYVAVIRLGIVENVSVLGKEASRTEGSLNIIDTKTGRSVLFDDTIQAVGYGLTTEEAEDSALRAGGKAALSVLMLEFLK